MQTLSINMTQNTVFCFNYLNIKLNASDLKEYTFADNDKKDEDFHRIQFSIVFCHSIPLNKSVFSQMNIHIE